MEAKIPFKLYTQQLKIQSYICLHVLISLGEKKKPKQKQHTKKTRARSAFGPACMERGSAPTDSLTLVFYHECPLMSNRYFPEGPVISFSVAVLTGLYAPFSSATM